MIFSRDVRLTISLEKFAFLMPFDQERPFPRLKSSSSSPAAKSTFASKLTLHFESLTQNLRHELRGNRDDNFCKFLA